MSNLYLRNNIIAFIVHVFIVIFVCVFNRHAYPFPGSTQIIPVEFLSNILIIFCSLIYVACGFFLLKPVEKYSFLSVISLPIILLLAFIFLMSQAWRGDVWGFFYYYVNPIAFMLSGQFSSVFQPVLVFLSPLFPSLLMWLGMVLRRLIFKG